ncbi:MAG TPA: ABC transporter ATP-binding protein [Candidatus Acidoferrum sp.]|nr:ABC transporter ATP-binding protein [Candidatus Acidoferrum sp.]
MTESSDKITLENLLNVRGLTMDYASVDGRVRVLENVSLRMQKGEIVGIVGESGSGKTTLGLSIIGLLDKPPAEIINGSIIFEGNDLLKLDPIELPHYRGTGIGMVFQEALAALNPVYQTEAQLRESLEVLARAQKLSLTTEAEAKMMVDILKDLRLDNPEWVLKKYPHELSGGMRQRVSIAMAIVEKPRLLILDEVTTGLDVYVQNRILNILKDLNRRTGTTMMLITHDLMVASQICDRLYVMYAGRVMEEGKTDAILSNPKHPYTQKLFAAIPQGFVDSPPLPAPIGEPPDLRKLPTGCKFHPRCPFVMQKCKDIEPPVFNEDGRNVVCWLAEKT